MTLTRKRGTHIARNAKVALKSYKNLLRRTGREQRGKGNNLRQCKTEDQVVWMTTEQVGFPTTTSEGEIDNDLDRQLGKPKSRCLHPVISAFILHRQQELSAQDRAPSIAETRSLELEIEWGTQEVLMEDSDRSTDSSEDTTWEPNPLPLMVKHPPRVTDPTRRYI